MVEKQARKPVSNGAYNGNKGMNSPPVNLSSLLRDRKVDGVGEARW